MFQPDPCLRRDRLWQSVQKILGELPSRQFQQALLLGHNLGMAYADDGQPGHILARARDYPLLDQHLWLLDDWGILQRESFEQSVFTASAFDFLALKTSVAICDPHSFFDSSYQPLANELKQQAESHWKKIFSDSSPFWTHYQTARAASLAPASSADPLRAADHWAFASLSLIATASFCGKETLIPQLASLSDHLCAALQTVEHLANFRRDLINGVITPPIARALAAIHADSSNLSAELVLGALIFTGSLEKTLQENEAHIASARAIAAELNLPTFQAWCDRLNDLMLQARELFSIKPAQTPSEGKLPRAFFTPAHDVLQNVILKAESYLLADTSFEEAWEIQQNSYVSASKLIGRPFPSSLILEILCQHGHDMSASIEAVLQCLQDSDFQYYDNSDFLVPDADDLALALSVIPYTSDPAHFRAIFQTPLRWMRENQLPSGQIPVWLRLNDSHQLSELAVLYGANCASVETNLLLGLLVYDFDGCRDVIESCAQSWCERWLAVGLAASEHYTPLYSLWAGMELITQLETAPVSDALKEQLRRTADYFRQRLECESRRGDLTPQDASFLILACLSKSDCQSDLHFIPDWITILFKNQRHDGCWEGEPIYIVPSARGLTTQWFRSRAITTAFCYHALKTYKSHLQESQHG